MPRGESRPVSDRPSFNFGINLRDNENSSRTSTDRSRKYSWQVPVYSSCIRVIDSIQRFVVVETNRATRMIEELFEVVSYVLNENSCNSVEVTHAPFTGFPPILGCLVTKN